MLEGAGGLPGPAPTVEFDRAAAIARAVSVAEPGDTVLVAGKGHELGQEVAGTVRPFDDRVVLRAVLERGAHTIGSQP
jgi:UDP-N-acetylmuramoyl-L-alanyl-D-glutamate--2,6-diaminopimelate ligase